MRDAIWEGDHLDEFRWCIHCAADCWPDVDNQQHDRTCPFETGLWPNDDPLAGCVMCHAELDEFYVLIEATTSRVATRPEVGETVCLGCGAITEGEMS